MKMISSKRITKESAPSIDPAPWHVESGEVLFGRWAFDSQLIAHYWVVGEIITEAEGQERQVDNKYKIASHFIYLRRPRRSHFSTMETSVIYCNRVQFNNATHSNNFTSPRMHDEGHNKA